MDVESETDERVRHKRSDCEKKGGKENAEKHKCKESDCLCQGRKKWRAMKRTAKEYYAQRRGKGDKESGEDECDEHEEGGAAGWK